MLILVNKLSVLHQCNHINTGLLFVILHSFIVPCLNYLCTGLSDSSVSISLANLSFINLWRTII